MLAPVLAPVLALTMAIELRVETRQDRAKEIKLVSATIVAKTMNRTKPCHSINRSNRSASSIRCDIRTRHRVTLTVTTRSHATNALTCMSALARLVEIAISTTLANGRAGEWIASPGAGFDEGLCAAMSPNLLRVALVAS